MNEKTIFTAKEITNVVEAREVVEKYPQKEQKCKIAMIIAAAATAMVWGGLALGIEFITSLGLIACVVSYIFGGGIFYMIRAAFRFGTVFALFCPGFIGWIFGECIGIVIGLLIFFLMPIIFVFKNYRLMKKEKKVAEMYLAQYSI